MKSAYIDYSMSVIVSRALPDVRDGLKPVHRRVLYGMSELGLSSNKAPKKSARIVGEVLGKYHPHGDTSVYDSMVRMAQDWSLRYPLVNGQGNFGSMDGDSPAAMRYTEARLQKISDEILADIKKDTVDFSLNFDDSLTEPTVLPTKLPNLLINGASGIAVGMATNMLPHNLTEVINGIAATVDNPDITITELIEFIKAPDFPTGGIIYGYEGVVQGFETGRGRVIVRAKTDIVENNGKERIIVNEIPYQVNKATLVAKIAELVNDKKIEGISDLRDESDRNGLRIVIEIRRDAMASVVLSKLFKYTALQNSYGVNNIALVNGRPMQLNLKDLIEEFIKFRFEVIVRRTQFDLKKALSRAHILVGLMVALDYLDAVISLIRGSKTPVEAREGLMKGAFIDNMDDFWKKFKDIIDNSQTDEFVVQEGDALSIEQAKAILELRLQKLTGLERDSIRAEYEELLKHINHFRAILASEDMQRDIIKEELADIKERYGDERRTEINYAGGDISIEDLIKDEEVVVTISHLGYIKRTAASEYRTQSRGGRGSRGSKTRNADFIAHMFAATNHNYLLLFTEKGKCYWIRIYEIPEATKTSSGRVIQNILAMPKDDKVRAYIIVKDLKDEEFLDNNFIMFGTKKGVVKKTPMRAFSRPRVGGIIAITVRDGDELLEARLTNGSNEIFMGTRNGIAIRFDEKGIRSMGRSAAGVRGVRLGGEDDAVIGMISINPEDKSTTIFVVSEKGNGKRSNFDDYRLTKRGGKGVKTMQITDKTGALVAIKAVKEGEDDLMITTRLGVVIRMEVTTVRVMGRATQGVRVIRIDKKDEIADVAVVPHTEIEEAEVEGENIEGGENQALPEGTEGDANKAAEDTSAEAAKEDDGDAEE